uniref:G-protein coupled receptors family 1 profile domain-containing protein n=1 Tax=Denticeps clupeoides TaxID=299321 RepID=A0AAY4CS52_9TELE
LLTAAQSGASGAHHHLPPGDLRLAVPATLALICVVGLALNVTAAAALVSSARKTKLSLINALILNLLAADALLLTVSAPLRAAAFSRPAWTLGWLACKSCDWVLQACTAAKSVTVAVMAKACERYVSEPTKHVTIRAKSVALLLLLLWTLGGVAALPDALFAELRPAGGAGGAGGALVCARVVPGDARAFMSVYVKLYPLMTYCAPLLLALLYFWRARGRCRRRCSKTQNLRAQMRSRKLTLTLFGLTVTMATLWLPQWVWWVWSRHAAATPPPLLSVAAKVLVFGAALLDPLLVLALSDEFRESYKDLWRRLTLRKPPPTKPKAGPHTPTAPRSPTPRPETAHLPKPEDDARQPDSPPNDGVVLPDLEQFWHEREGGSHADENDPVPWEHQDAPGDRQ